MRTTLFSIAIIFTSIVACDGHGFGPARHPLGISVACFGAGPAALFILGPNDHAKDVTGDLAGTFTVSFDDGHTMDIHSSGTCLMAENTKEALAAAGVAAATAHPSAPASASALVATAPVASAAPSAPVSAPVTVAPASAPK